MTIAITGASGHLGRRTTEHLLAVVDPSELVLITRRPETLAARADQGVSVRFGDFGRPDSLAAAFAGVDHLLIVSTDVVGDRLAGQLAAVDAAKAAGVGHLAYTSAPRPTPDNPAGVIPDHAATEQALIASGVPWTALRNNIYADMQAAVVQQGIATGQIVTNAGEGRVAYVGRDDCAAAAAAVLRTAGSGRHDGKAYEITGPDAVSAAALATLAAELGGRPVEVVDVDDETYVAGLTGAGLPPELAALLGSFGTAYRLGFFDHVTTAVEDLTGHAPRSLHDVVAAELGKA